MVWTQVYEVENMVELLVVVLLQLKTIRDVYRQVQLQMEDQVHAMLAVHSE